MLADWSIDTGVRLETPDFERALGDKASPFLQEKIRSLDLRFRYLSAQERDDVIRMVVARLLDDQMDRAGSHRQALWEKGWGENLSALTHMEVREALRPKYFGKYRWNRWRGEWIEGLSDHFEPKMLSVIEYWLFDKYFRNAKSIYEFGCGTGHNLLRMREVNAEAKLTGLDWAASSQKILTALREQGVDSQIHGESFNYFEPRSDFHLDAGAHVFTVASLEQIGKKIEPFLQYLLRERPELVVHIEPIEELLSETDLPQYLSLEYFKKRHYLSGYLTRLRELESEKKIEILRAQRTGIGSLFIEGYSVIAWRVRS